MLAPAHPDPLTPDYDRRLQAWRRARRAAHRNPGAWGWVRPLSRGTTRTATAAAGSPASPREAQ